jgi:glyoxylase-like metal-dependent hydrolase (beta-lactamase superfamily II)
MAERLVDGVWLLDLGFIAPVRANAYLVEEALLDGDGVTLVDTGLHRNWPTLVTELADAGYSPEDVDRVLLTHYDLDHVGGIGRLLPEFDGPVYIGGADHDLLSGEVAPPIHHKGLFHRVTRRLFPVPAELDLRRVEDGDRIGTFTAYLTPGHNPGHVVYVHDAGIAFLGDLVWEDGGRLTTPIRFDSYDVAEIGESVRSLAARVEPFTVAAMGHGRPLATGGYEALQALAAEV